MPAPIRTLLALLDKREAAPAPTRRTVLPPRRTAACVDADEYHRAVIAAARILPDGTPASEELIAAITAEIATRRHGAGLEDGPDSPTLTGPLHIRRADLPDWWEDSGSLMLISPESKPIEVALGLLGLPVDNSLIVVGAGVTPPRVQLTGPEGLVVIGDNVCMLTSAVSVGDGATLLIGEGTTSTWMMSADMRNGGMVVIGKDCMIAIGVNFMTDDSHAIRDAETGARINLRGGRIIVEDHVWIGDQTRLMGDARIGAGSVIGATSFVKNVHLPPNAVSVGRPARPIRTGIVWTREDAP